jgi:serine/threonine protein kinase
VSDSQDSAWLIALGTDISEGRPVDWEEANRLATDRETRKLVESLRQLSAVVDAQRSQPWPAGPDAEPAPPPDEPAAAAAAGHWHHLVLYERVGAGAFGTVYRGWDTKLDREVAVKLLSKPRAAGVSPLTEARHLARVRHPNVVTVYGAEQDQEHVAIWMEFIHGDTLAALVQERGPMSAREVAGIGIDLCRALSALHGASLLHRDIKAHNVMREVGGRVVLMDFSGVRALVPTDGPGELSGTPLYMAPELFAGREATVAAEVYSLGVLLFYLLSGRYPVEGATLADVKISHAGGARTRLRDLRPELPESTVQVVERACSPDPGARHHTVGELEHALMGALGTHVLSGPATADDERRRSRMVRWGAAAAGLAILLLSAAAWPRGGTPSDSLLVRYTLGPPYNTRSWPRISPDGRTIMFGTWENGKDFLWSWALDSLQGRPFLESGARETAFWSGDSRYVGFFADGKLKKISTLPDALPEVLTDVPFPRGADWNDGGTILFAAENGIQRIDADGSGQQAVTTLDAAAGDSRHAWPSFLPDGRRFLFLIRSSDAERSGVYLGSLDSSRVSRIMPPHSRTVYARSGQLLFVRDGTLLAQPVADETALQPRGDPVPIASNVRAHSGGDAAFDVSDTDVLIYRLSEGLSSIRLQVYDRRGRPLQVIAPPGFYRQPRLSPDGRRVAVETVEAGSSEPDIWIFDMVRGSATKFTSHAGADVRPTWSPDGRRIAFSSRRGAQFDIYVKTVDTTEPEQLVDSSPGDKFVEHWSPAGGWLAVTILRSGLWLRPLTTGQKPVLVRAGASDFWHAEFSPDGRRIAYVTDELGRAEVYVEPLPKTGERWQVSTQGGTDPHWRGDGHELVYLAPEGGIMSVEVEPGPVWKASAPRFLFRASVPELFGGSDLSFAGDGGQFVINTVLGDPPVPPLHVIVNWSKLMPR